MYIKTKSKMITATLLLTTVLLFGICYKSVRFFEKI